MVLVNLSDPESVATLILNAAVCQYDPGTAPWLALHQAADEIREALDDQTDPTMARAAEIEQLLQEGTP